MVICYLNVINIVAMFTGRSSFFSFFQMAELEKKLQMEMKDDSQIIVCRFPLPNLKASRIIGGGVDTVWVYNIKKAS